MGEKNAALAMPSKIPIMTVSAIGFGPATAFFSPVGRSPRQGMRASGALQWSLGLKGTDGEPQAAVPLIEWLGDRLPAANDGAFELDRGRGIGVTPRSVSAKDRAAASCTIRPIGILYQTIDAVGRDRRSVKEAAGAEGATAPESLRPKDRPRRSKHPESDGWIKPSAEGESAYWNSSGVREALRLVTGGA